MAEERVFINSGELKIESLLDNLSGDNGVVVTHPHPLFGGDMYNNVVTLMQKAFQEQGHSTLRFNFRGVGASGGTYDQGDGEGRDVVAALQTLRATGISSADLAGYSFGAWVNAKVASNGQAACDKMIMIAPPAGLLPFPTALNLPSLSLVVIGGRDSFAPPELLKQQVSIWNPTARLEVIADGQMRTYTIDLGSMPGYHGLMTGLRLDPIANCRPGDRIDLVSLTIE